jgi:4-amino-4-deoxy-L-arabinose transferase-like glycosyltransferase
MRFLTEETKMAAAARLVAIAAFAAFVASAGVFTMPPLDRDESRFAQATAQMLESGDFVRIRFQLEERNKKPPGIHWLQAASVAAFSSVEARDIWAYRLPSAAGAVLAALFTYLAGARLFDRATGVLAALLLASAPAVAGEAMIAKTDAMLLAAVAAGQTALLHVYFGVLEQRRAALLWPAAFWLALACGVLIKGPIVALIAVATGAALFWRRPTLDWIRALRPVSGVIIATALVAPWALAIQAATAGRFLAEAVGSDMLAKIGEAKERHGGPPLYHAALLLALFWPAAALLPPAVRQAVADRGEDRMWFLIAWIAPAWIALELAATKLPHYALPLYPALAILAAHAVLGGAAARFAVLRRIGAAAFALIGLALAALIVAAPSLYGADALSSAAQPAAAAFAIASLAAFLLYWRARVMEGTFAGIILSAALAWTLLAGFLPQLDRLAVSPRLDRALDALALHPLRDGAPPVALAGYHEPSAVFLLGTQTVLTDGAGAADHVAARGGAAVVESREESAFQARLTALGARAVRAAEIEGVNYSNGRAIRLALYRRAP